jgi:hypothetical protein
MPSQDRRGRKFRRLAAAAMPGPAGATLGLRRADSKVVRSTTPSAYTLEDGGHSTVLATGTNEPWIVVCDDDSNATVAGTNLVADCVHSQSPKSGVKLGATRLLLLREASPSAGPLAFCR